MRGVRIVSFPVHLDAATAVDRHIWEAEWDGELLEIRESHVVAGGAAAALMVERCASGVAPGAGVDMLAANIDLTLGANTPRKASLHATPANRFFRKGEQISLDASGTMTGLAGCGLTFTVRQEREGDIET